MGKFFRTYRHITAAALLLTFLLYIGNIYLFTHSHTIGGVKVAHSHIYFGSQDAPNHNHSAQQFNILHLLSTFNADQVVFTTLSEVVLSLLDIIAQRECNSISQLSTPYHSLRAPPVMIYV